MRITAYFQDEKAHIHIHKSRSKHKDSRKGPSNDSRSKQIFTQIQKFSPKIQQSVDQQSKIRKSIALETTKSVRSKSRNDSKCRHRCAHKEMQQKSVAKLNCVKSQYFKPRRQQGERCNHRMAQDIQKQNEQLRLENKILNDYYEYFEQKHVGKQVKSPEKIFSFRHLTDNLLTNARRDSGKKIDSTYGKPSIYISESRMTSDRGHRDQTKLKEGSLNYLQTKSNSNLHSFY